jgi:hypothetical protein
MVRITLTSRQSGKNGTKLQRLSEIFTKIERRRETYRGRIPNNKKDGLLASQPKFR